MNWFFTKKSVKQKRRRSRSTSFDHATDNHNENENEDRNNQVADESRAAPAFENTEQTEDDIVSSTNDSKAGVGPDGATQSVTDGNASIFADLKAGPAPKYRERTSVHKPRLRKSKATANKAFSFKPLNQIIENITKIIRPKKDTGISDTTGKKPKYKINGKRFQIVVIGTGAVCLAVIFLLIFGTGPKNAFVKNESAQALSSSFSASTPTPVPTPTPTPEPSLEPGVTTAKVAELQQRLMDLYYMAVDEPTEYYGPQTKLAVELFQRKHELSIDGIAGEQTLALLFSDEAKTYSVSLGISGTDVEEIQTRLVELGYMNEATGNFGEVTEGAVKEFQTRNGLSVDGTVGQQTLEMLYSEDVKAYSVSSGMTGDEVKTLQERLKKLGYLSAADGVFGKETVEAVKRFQTVNGLIADGHIGPQTKSVLYSSDAQSDALVIGDSGTTVENVQKQLVKLKYMTKATGYYGDGTESAVKAFQKRNGLSADGKVGKNTMNKLFSSSAKAAAKTTTGGNTGGNTGGSPSEPSDTSTLEKFIAAAESKLGAKYVRGAKGPNSFDCSGFVYWCLNKAGVRQGYLTSYAWRTYSKYTRITKMSDIRRGDVIVYKMSSSSGHVGIAISNSMMIDASSNNGKVVKRGFTSSYWQKVFYCAYRVF